MPRTDAARRSPSGCEGRPAHKGPACLRAFATLVVLLAALTLAAPAAAAPGDLDPGFGAGGVTSLPGADRYEAQDEPLVSSNGRITVAGLLRNASDRVFLTRLEAGGTVDASFGGGDLHTTVIAAGRRAATATTGDGRTLVAGAGEKAGRIVLERYTASGAADTTFGNKGRIQLDLGGTYARPSATWVLPDGKTLLAVITDAGGGAAFTVLRFTASGLDRTFGANGIARVTFGSGPSAARDLEVLSNDMIAVVGSAGTEGDAGSDTAVARLQANGALDTSFAAGGRLRVDANGAAGADHAVAVAAERTGALTITGPAGGDGYVARITAAGALEPGFGTAGILRGGLAAGLPGGAAGTFAPADVALDRDGLILATGATRGPAALGLPALSRWTVARLNRTGTAPLDPDFGQQGRATAPVCDNRSGNGPSGLTIVGSRVLVLGSCGDGGVVAVARFLGVKALPTGATLAISPLSEAAGRRRVPLSGIDPTKVLGAVETLQGAALRNSALRNSALRNSALRNSALRNSALRNSALRNSALSSTLVQSIALRNSSWEEILRGRLDIPLQYVTLGDVLALDPPPPGLAQLTLADVDLNTTALRNSSLAALLLEPRPLASVPGDWCARIADQPLNCSNAADPSTTTLLDLEMAGDRLDYDAPIGLAGAELGSGDSSAELARILLVDVNLARTPLGAVKAADVSDLLSCGAGCSDTLAEAQQRDPLSFSSATLGQLLAKLPLPGVDDATLGQVLAGLVPPEEIPFERAPLGDLLAAAEPREARLQRHRLSFEVDCDQSTGLRAAIDLPPLARIAPGTATRTTNGGAPQPVADAQRDAALENLPTFRLPGACAGLPAGSLASVTLAFDVEPGATLGPAEARALVRTDAAQAPVRATATAIADDSLDAGEADATAQPLGDERLVTGHVSSAGDADDYTFQAQPGSVVTLSLSHLPADYDLLVFGPETGLESSALRNSALRNSALRNSSTPDASAERASDPERLAPDTLQDLALRNSALRNSALRNSSINRGSLDESATIAIRGTDAGETFTVRVAGYNGAHDDKPYVLRMRVTPPTPVKPCAPRAPLSGGAAGAFPSLPLAAGTRTLVLVNRRRYAARYGDAAATRMMSAATAYANRDDVKGVVVPVEGDPDAGVDAAAAAWDADPCSVEAANGYAAAVNDVVDHVRAGLDELRFITVVGGDDIVAQPRVPDLSVLANEREYADALSFGGQDTAQSRAVREGYLLSDDPIGDFDPQARRGAPLYIPDVAVGRLVEMPAEIERQFAQYQDSGGILDPSSAFVSGYDFIKDGATEIRDALAPALPAGATSSRIDENWTAADALGAINRSTAAFTSVNAHYDHYRALPAAAFNGTQPDLLHAADANPAPGSLLFNVGCHGGLNVPAVSVALSSETERLGDWPQQAAAHGALTVGNTGFGYGDTEAVAYSERLMAGFARGLASHDVTAGQALLFAKQHYAATLATGDDYDAKSLAISTFYGLPTYRLGTAGGVGEPALPDEPATGGGAPLSLPFALDIAPTEVVSDRGRHWEVPGFAPLVVQRRPIQPRVTRDVTSDDGLPAHGVLVDGLRTTDVPGVDPVYPVPAIDLAEHEPEPDADGVIFPAHLAAVTGESTADGRRDVLDLVAGQFRDDPGDAAGRGTQSLITRISGRVLRSASDDWDPASVLRVDGRVVNGGVVFTVDVDAADATGGVLLYRVDGDALWRRLNLAPAGDRRLSGAAPVPAGTAEVDSAIAQVLDDAGNVGTGRFKGRGYIAQRLPAPDPGGPRFVFDPAQPASGWYGASPAITLDPGIHGPASGFVVSIDGGPETPYTGAFTIPAPVEGSHVLTARAADGAQVERIISIDAQGPVVTGTILTQPEADGTYHAPVTVRWSCADATSGVATCPPDSVLTTTGLDQSVSASAADLAGNTGTGTVSGIDILPDVEAGFHVTIDPIPGGVLARNGTLRGRATDTLAAVTGVKVVYVPSGGFSPGGGNSDNPRTGQATLSCDAGRNVCTWAAAAPPRGTWDARATATDADGRTATSDKVSLTVP